MYTHRVYAAATRAGVSCLSSSGAEHLVFIFCRFVLLKLSEATRDSSMAYANFRRCDAAVYYSWVGRMRSTWVVCDPFGSYSIHWVRFRRNWPLGTSLVEVSGMLRNVSRVKCHNLSQFVNAIC